MGIGMFIFLFVTAVSIDSFGIGCVLGLKKVGLTFKGVLLISCVSGGMFLLSSYLGHILTSIVSPEDAERVGALALIGIGIYFLWQFFKKEKGDEEGQEPWLNPTKVLNDPVAADVDRSGGIHGKEVWLLGAALSLDTIGAGISGALIGIPTLFTAVMITAATFFMLSCGILSGSKLSNKAESLSILPGVLLIVIGLIKLS
ncbi:manganese efflux pump [Halobacillus karajensis]|uniref:Sporulation protein YtaF n=1 Tax=Halobacillus karajensis TaxID=195088 RepID=A0A024P8F9_9BACI|nr:manganese efflux pump [Halobacillus karajensis]CDQ18269.1 putative sporulation protein YtaF [Halobacillus karajensis]CDQ24622.1 putative sporulation protein YtaF [Halobacillus karajensis]CDQ29131.1 putative sporulation protein YtaF [Halobacillus karajensis]